MHERCRLELVVLENLPWSEPQVILLHPPPLILVRRPCRDFILSKQSVEELSLKLEHLNQVEMFWRSCIQPPSILLCHCLVARKGFETGPIVSARGVG